MLSSSKLALVMVQNKASTMELSTSFQREGMLAQLIRHNRNSSYYKRAINPWYVLLVAFFPQTPFKGATETFGRFLTLETKHVILHIFFRLMISFFFVQK